TVERLHVRVHVLSDVEVEQRDPPRGHEVNGDDDLLFGKMQHGVAIGRVEALSEQTDMPVTDRPLVFAGICLSRQRAVRVIFLSEEPRSAGLRDDLRLRGDKGSRSTDVISMAV